MATAKARRIVWAAGAVLTIGGIVTGVQVLQKLETKIADMVRTPSGCESNVRFTGTGEFFVYVETQGVVGDLGSCGNDERTYSVDSAPDVEVYVTTADGESIELHDDTTVKYDNNDFAGESVYAFDIATTDEYVVSVSGDADAVVAIGRNVAPEAQVVFMVAAFTMLAGIVLLIVALVQTLGWKRRSRRAPLVVNYADGSMTWAPPTLDERAFRDDATR